jgi:hypothetical protein
MRNARRALFSAAFASTILLDEVYNAFASGKISKVAADAPRRKILTSFRYSPRDKCPETLR